MISLLLSLQRLVRNLMYRICETSQDLFGPDVVKVVILILIVRLPLNVNLTKHFLFLWECHTWLLWQYHSFINSRVLRRLWFEFIPQLLIIKSQWLVQGWEKLMTRVLTIENSLVYWGWIACNMWAIPLNWLRHYDISFYFKSIIIIWTIDLWILC